MLINEDGNRDGKGYLPGRSPLSFGGLLNSMLVSASIVSCLLLAKTPSGAGRGGRFARAEVEELVCQLRYTYICIYIKMYTAEKVLKFRNVMVVPLLCIAATRR